MKALPLKSRANAASHVMGYMESGSHGGLIEIDSNLPMSLK